MKKYLCKVDKSCDNFRVSIPKELIRLLRWGDVQYVLVEHQNKFSIAIRRMLDEKALGQEARANPAK